MHNAERIITVGHRPFRAKNWYWPHIEHSLPYFTYLVLLGIILKRKNHNHFCSVTSALVSQWLRCGAKIQTHEHFTDIYLHTFLQITTPHGKIISLAFCPVSDHGNNVVPVLGDNPVVLGAMDASNEQLTILLSILWLRPTHEPYSPVASFPGSPVQKLGDSLGTRLILQWTWDLQMLLEKNTWSFIYVGQERMMTSLFFQWCHHALLCWVIILKLQPSEASV